MTSIDIEVSGLDAVKDRLDFDKIKSLSGHVFSMGANQGRGRYEQYVQSARYQAFMHQGRWQTDEDATTETREFVEDIFNDEVKRVIAGGGNIRKAMNEALKLVYDFMRVYPPKPANSRYIRTGTLKDSYRYRIK